jgi:hypothetical protein
MKISHRGKASKKPMRNGFAAVTVALFSSGRYALRAAERAKIA